MKPLVVAGSGRSGTTWIAELLAAFTPTRLVFEPFHAKVSAGRNLAFRYERPGCESPALAAFWRAALRGQLRIRWVRHVHKTPRKPAVTLVKVIRANVSLPWLRWQFPEVPILFVVRDPRAVVASRFRREWTAEALLRTLLSQPALTKDHLPPPLLACAQAAASEAEQAAAMWAIENHVVLRQAKKAGIRILSYEQQLADPEAALLRLAAASGLPFPREAMAAFDRPSQTAY